MFTVKKSYRDLPAAHRQPTHKGHCRLIHGHNWGFDISFTCDTLDGNGFVIDVGELGFVRYFLEEHFDHTLLLNENDPALVYLENALQEGDVNPYAKVVTIPNCGMEGLAKFVFHKVQHLLNQKDVRERGLKVVAVVCMEDSKNSSTYANFEEKTSSQDIQLR